LKLYAFIYKKASASEGPRPQTSYQGFAPGPTGGLRPPNFLKVPPIF